MSEVMFAETADRLGLTEEASGAGPQVVDQPCRHYGPQALSWNEHPELEPFMRATYEAHVTRSCARRSFEPSVPRSGPHRGGQGQVPAPRRGAPGAADAR